MKALKVSICIPQYNRIAFLAENIRRISSQTYPHIEIVVSDDQSTDDTQEQITALASDYPFPILYSRNEKNLGYDANLRRSMELASGDYCVILGNDDTLARNDAISILVDFLEKNDLPEVGYCNYAEALAPGVVFSRAQKTGILGTGPDLALQVFSNFSFVAGLIYKRASFLRYNNPRQDGSIYVQIYLSCCIIAGGGRVFSIAAPLVLKDLIVPGVLRDTYRDKIARRWSDFKVVDGGLPSVLHVIVEAFKDSGTLPQKAIWRIFRRIYSTTFPFWLLDYRSHGAFPEAVGMVLGLRPARNRHYASLSVWNKLRLQSYYLFFAALGLFTPLGIFRKYKVKVYSWLRRRTGT